ncbi:MAG: hypothetical protein BEN18_05230 [Epulopiscium sp. Nuni2H_MBin001]|nr:MAG: hypothetical protein BEN18_05230 [Epulopiscium sp. Nuni2H_MBin001]
MLVVVAGKVDIGRKRTCNQDKILICDKRVGSLPNLLIVADGVGGDNSGEVASELAIDSFYDYITEHEGADLSTPELIANLLTRAISHANYVVFERSQQDAQCKGMGTTFTLATVIGEHMYISHVGDTRVYVMNNKQVIQLTTDHSLVQEMFESGILTREEVFNHPMGHYITRAVGTAHKIKVDNIMCELKHVEYILLCSDGLTSMINENDLKEIVYSKKEVELEMIVENLINEANSRGGPDNIAVILAKKCEVI